VVNFGRPEGFALLGLWWRNTGDFHTFGLIAALQYPEGHHKALVELAGGEDESVADELRADPREGRQSLAALVRGR